MTETRGCIRKEGFSNGCRYQEVDAGFMFYCLCSDDDCNSAKITAINMLLLIGALFVSLIFAKSA